MDDVKQLYGKPWSEREYVIALHYYFQNRSLPRHVTISYIRELSELLGRTPAAVVMRMQNFGSIDPDAERERQGLAHAGPMCVRIFNLWCGRQDSLQACAELLIRDMRGDRNLSLFEPQSVPLPRAFNSYELLDCIGEGAAGSVYSCIHAESQQQFAIKIIRADNRFDRETLHRFSREIRILSEVHHPNVIQLHERNFDTEEKYPAFIMDLAECSLTQHLQTSMSACNKRPCLDRSEASLILRSVASGVQALHSAGIIHRDINPNNVLRLPSGRWVLADFGLAKYLPSAATATSFVTSTHVGWGTAYYAAPEQYRDFRQTNERSDIYALGMLLWELFTSSWPPPENAESGLPRSLTDTFSKSVTREPTNRYASVAQFMRDFDSWLDMSIASPEQAEPVRGVR